MYYVYVIQSRKDQRYYIGFTSDIVDRVKAHNAEKSRYTKAYVPWDLIYYEAYEDESIARKREIKLKKSSWHKDQLISRLKDSSE